MDYLSQKEAEQILCGPDIRTPLGIRDRAILELFYSAGIRRSELTRLEVVDINFDRGVVHIHEGKGQKDRVVPIGTRALTWVNRYLTEVRPEYVFGKDARVLFLGYDGMPLDPGYLGQHVRGYVERSGVDKRGSCHLFRHTMATLMLENGADVRYIQAILGHSNLTATQRYTQVSIAKLKAVHEATHPAEQALGPEPDDVSSSEDLSF